MHRSPVLLCGGLRALITQSFHPHAMAGVAQHSNYLERPLDRLKRTAAVREHGGLRRHRLGRGRGRAGEAGTPEGAGRRPDHGRRVLGGDVESLLWVHCAEVHSFLASFRAYGGEIDEGEQDRYLAEQVAAAELMGIPARMVPATRAEYREYFASDEATAVRQRGLAPGDRSLRLPSPDSRAAAAAGAAAGAGDRGDRDHPYIYAADRRARAGALAVSERRSGDQGGGEVLVLPGFRETPRAAIGGPTMEVARGAIEASEVAEQ